MSERIFLDYLEDMIESCEDILVFTSNQTYEEFINDKKTLNAVIRSLEILGEAANKIPHEFRVKYKKIYWKEIIAMRNKLIHEYFGIDYKILWETIKSDIPFLLNDLKVIIN
ncbi:MAG: DUF86 domain-containing protein [Candidatus Muiribacteriota bacterium]